MTMAKPALGLLLALVIGSACRLFGVPVPAPPAIVGGLLVLSMTLGYLAVGRVAGHRPTSTAPLCGGPTGSPADGEMRP
jgi:XapX domain-containing protein